MKNSLPKDLQQVADQISAVLKRHHMQGVIGIVSDKHAGAMLMVDRADPALYDKACTLGSAMVEVAAALAVLAEAVRPHEPQPRELH